MRLINIERNSWDNPFRASLWVHPHTSASNRKKKVHGAPTILLLELEVLGRESLEFPQAPVQIQQEITGDFRDYRRLGTLS